MFYLFFYFVHLKSARGIIMNAVVLFSAILIFVFNFKRIRAASPPRAYDHGRSPFLPFHGRDPVVCFRRVSGSSSWPPWLTRLGSENLRPASCPPPTPLQTVWCPWPWPRCFLCPDGETGQMAPLRSCSHRPFQTHNAPVTRTGKRVYKFSVSATPVGP